MARCRSSTVAFFCSCSACKDMSTNNSTSLKRAQRTSWQHPELQNHRSASHQPPRQAFFCNTGGGGGEILEEAGTFSGQALLLSYAYP